MISRNTAFGARAYTYKTTVPPVNLAVSLATVKSHLRVTSSAEDSLITLYIKSATDFAEKFTRRDLITRTYETFRDFFPAPSQNEGYYPLGQIPSSSSFTSSRGANTGFEIRKSPIQTVDSIEYLKDDVLTLVPSSVYYSTLEQDYSEVLTNLNQRWPQDADNKMQSVKITFKTGFGDTDTDVPAGYQQALLEHIASLYFNRGDCEGSNGGLPESSKIFYLQNRIENL